MPVPATLVQQIDRALNDLFVHEIAMDVALKDADPIDEMVIRTLDVNAHEHEQHILALLRYPEAAGAVKLLAEVQRGYLMNILGKSVEFAHIIEVLQTEE